MDITSDIDYLVRQSSDQIGLTIAGMVALLKSTDDKVYAMETQNWFQRMIKTIFGKNKLTQEEIRQNHDKLNAYMSEAIAELYKRQCIDDRMLVCLNRQLNEVFSEQVQLKQMLRDCVKKLNEKIDSVDNYYMLEKEIEQGKYSAGSPVLAICMILSQLDERAFRDARKIQALKTEMINQRIISANQIPIKEYLMEVIDAELQDISEIYLYLNMFKNNYLAGIFIKIIEQYHFLSEMERRIKDKNAVVDNIVSEESIDPQMKISVEELFENFACSQKEALESDLSTIIEEGICDNSVDSGKIQTENEPSNSTVIIDIAMTPGVISSVNSDNLSEEALSGIISVEAGSVKKISGKYLHFGDGIIDCAGELIIDNCIICFNEENKKGRIVLKEESNIIISNSKIVCWGCDIEEPFYRVDKSRYFICNETGKAVRKAVFQNCSFINCSYFVNLSDCKELILNNCELLNCYSGFLHVNRSNSSDVSAKLTNSKIFIEDVVPFNDKKNNGAGPIIYMNGFGSDGEVANCLFEEGLHVKKYDVKGCNSISRQFEYLICRGIPVRKCSFIGTSRAIECGDLIDCVFKDSSHSIGVFGSTVSCCRFEQCKYKLLRLHGEVKVSHCQFIHCEGMLIDADMNFDGGITIEYCHFLNIKDSPITSSGLLTVGIGDGQNSLIALFRGKRLRSRINTIKGCIFNGIDLNESFLIAAYDSFEKTCDGKCTIIEECIFKNCRTNRESGKIIKEYKKIIKSGIGPLKKDKDEKVNIIINCQGLDRINLDSATADESGDILMTTNSAGEPIGICE